MPTLDATLAPTPILDFDRAPFPLLAAQLRPAGESPRAVVQAAHRYLMQAVRPVYTVDELVPASRVLARRRGSCSQRMACLEALARASGVATRVRALWVDGRFWYPRFRLARPFIPRRILLTWPQFSLDGCWVDFDELHGSTAELVARTDRGFANDGETLFDAVSHSAVDWFGKSQDCGVACSVATVDLSRFILADEGVFATRDAAFARFGALQHSWRGRAFELIFGGRKSA